MLILAVLCAQLAASPSAGGEDAAAQARAPRLLWTRATAADEVAVSPSGDCVAIADGTTLTVFAASGRRLWRRPIHRFQQWRQGRSGEGVMAVAPGCAAAALGGSVDYRYVWLFGRGRSTYLKTRGTPRALGFSRRGRLLTVATWAGHLYLLGPRGTILRHDGPDARGWEGGGLVFDCGNPSYGLQSPHELDELLAIYARLDTPVSRVTLSRDRRWVAVSFAVAHGPGGGVAQLFKADGTPVWDRALTYADAAIAPDGSFVAASGDEALDAIGAADATDADDCHEAMVYDVQKNGLVPQAQCFVSLILDQAGRVVSRSGSFGRILLISEDGRCILGSRENLSILDCTSPQGTVTWSLPSNDHHGGRAAYSRDLRLLAILADGSLQVFTPPSAP